MREWGRVSPHVKAAVHAVDEERLTVLQAMFKEAGLSEDASLIRARILYYHQMGYYALEVYESRKRRLELMSTYKAALTGLDPDGLLSRR
jgi:hypothetical protein